jgi:hypothetical protein
MIRPVLAHYDVHDVLGAPSHFRAKDLAQSSKTGCIAEGNGKGTDGYRRRYVEIARGSALECGAVQNVLHVYGAITAEENEKAKALLDRIVAMLANRVQWGYAVHEDAEAYGASRIDPRYRP